VERNLCIKFGLTHKTVELVGTIEPATTPEGSGHSAHASEGHKYGLSHRQWEGRFRNITEDTNKSVIKSERKII